MPVISVDTPRATSISWELIDWDEAGAKPSSTTAVDWSKPVPVIWILVPAGKTPPPGDTLPTERFPPTWNVPGLTAIEYWFQVVPAHGAQIVPLHSGAAESALTSAVVPFASPASTGMETTRTGTPGSCPIPPDGERKYASRWLPSTFA